MASEDQKTFSETVIADQKASRAAFGSEQVVGSTQTFPRTPISVAIDLGRAWLKRAWLVAAAGMAPEEEGLIGATESSTVESILGGIVGGGNVRESYSRQSLLEQIKAAGEAGADGDVWQLMGVAKDYQVGQQQPITKYRVWQERTAQAFQHWALSPRNAVINGVPYSVLHPDDAYLFWTTLATMAVAADAASRRTVTLDSKIDAFVDTAKQRTQVTADWVAAKAAGAIDFAAETAGRAAFSFASASGVVLVLVVGGGIWYLAQRGGAGAVVAGG